MPQMKPMSWLFLYFMLFLSIMTFNIMFFFSLINKNKFINNSLNFKIKKNILNWKW